MRRHRIRIQLRRECFLRARCLCRRPSRTTSMLNLTLYPSTLLPLNPKPRSTWTILHLSLNSRNFSLRPTSIRYTHSNVLVPEHGAPRTGYVQNFIHREKNSRMVAAIVQGEQFKQFPGTLPLSWSVASIGMRCPNWLLLSLLALVGWRHEQINEWWAIIWLLRVT